MRTLLQWVGGVTLALSLVGTGVLLAPLVRPPARVPAEAIRWLTFPCPHDDDAGDSFLRRR